jgi:hypothetical protein
MQKLQRDLQKCKFEEESSKPSSLEVPRPPGDPVDSEDDGSCNYGVDDDDIEDPRDSAT